MESSPAEAIKPLDPDDLVHVRSRLVIRQQWSSACGRANQVAYGLAKDMAPPRSLFVPGKR